MKKYILICFLFNFYLTIAQTSEELLKAVSKNYSDLRPLQFDSFYNLYKKEGDKKAHESYRGTYSKNSKNECYMKVGDSEFINNEKIGIRIVPTEKMVVISDPNKFVAQNFDIKNLLSECKIQSFVNRKDFWELTLTVKPLSSINYSKIIIEIGKDYFIKRQSFYYNSAINFSKKFDKQDISYPILIVDFYNYNRNPVDIKKLSTDTYLILKNNKYYSKLPKYKISDERQSTLKNK